MYIFLNLTDSILCRIEILSEQQPRLHSVTFYSCSRTQTEFSELLDFLYDPNIPLKIEALSSEQYRSSQSHKRYRSLIYSNQPEHNGLHQEKKYKAFQHIHFKFDSFSSQILYSMFARLLHFQNRTTLRALQKKFLYLDRSIDLPDQYLRSPIITIDAAAKIMDAYHLEYVAENFATCKSPIFLDEVENQCYNHIIKDRYDSLQMTWRHYPELELKTNQTEFFYRSAIQAYEEGRSLTSQQALMTKIAGFTLFVAFIIALIVNHIKKSSPKLPRHFASKTNTIFDSSSNTISNLSSSTLLTSPPKKS